MLDRQLCDGHIRVHCITAASTEHAYCVFAARQLHAAVDLPIPLDLVCCLCSRDAWPFEWPMHPAIADASDVHDSRVTIKSSCTAATSGHLIAHQLEGLGT
jgi:hypothetical protein